MSTSNGLKCHICGKEGHVPNAGPGGIKLIQYVTCEQFVEVAPADWFHLLKKKGLCFWCLYPGAKITDIEHSEQKIQRVDVKGIIHAKIDHLVNFLQRSMSLFVLNIKMLKKTKGYLSCTNISAS